MTPKKPNSANRRVARAVFKTGGRLIAKIPGEKHSLQQHSNILVKHAKIRDLIGVNFSAIRGKFDLNGVSQRKTSRSIYGVKLS